jgi:hypothetical protein
MNEKIIIVDDLYDMPHVYHGGFFENKCVITDEMVGKISQILGRPISITEATNEQGTSSGVVAHLRCDWIAVIYMSLPLEVFGEMGIKFYSHKQTGLEAFPTQDEMRSLQLDERNLENIFSSDLDLWKEYGCVPARYNRLVMLKGNQWHSYNLNSDIKYQKIFVNYV